MHKSCIRKTLYPTTRLWLFLCTYTWKFIRWKTAYSFNFSFERVQFDHFLPECSSTITFFKPECNSTIPPPPPVTSAIRPSRRWPPAGTALLRQRFRWTTIISRQRPDYTVYVLTVSSLNRSFRINGLKTNYEIPSGLLTTMFRKWFSALFARCFRFNGNSLRPPVYRAT